jgi:hypothetical protein
VNQKIHIKSKTQAELKLWTLPDTLGAPEHIPLGESRFKITMDAGEGDAEVRGTSV